MKDRTFQLKVNGVYLNNVKGKDTTTKDDFIKFVRSIREFDESRDILEVIDITPPENEKILRHPARDKSTNNKYADAIISRHIINMINTYGEARLLRVLSESHSLSKTEKKAAG